MSEYQNVPQEEGSPASPPLEKFSQKGKPLCERMFNGKTVAMVNAENRAQKARDGVQLKRCLVIWDIFLYGIGSIIGAGIFILIGIGARLAGPSVALSYVISGVGATFAAFAYADFQAQMPVTGSAYLYTYVTWGEFPSWIACWNMLLAYGVSSALVGRGWIDYFFRFLGQLGINLPHFMHHIPIAKFIDLNISAGILTWILVMIVLGGVRGAASFNNFVTYFNLFNFAFCISYGFTFVEWKYISNFFPFGFTGCLRAAGVIFYSFVGFDLCMCLAEEAKNPKRDMPRGIISAIIFVTSMYFLLSFVCCGMVSIDSLQNESPVPTAFIDKGQADSAIVISAGVLFAMIAASFTGIMGQPRILYRVAKDGILCPLFMEVHPKTQVPQNAAIISGLITCAITVVFTIVFISDVINLGSLAVYSLICLAVIRKRSNNKKRTDVFLFGFWFLTLFFGFAYNYAWGAVYMLIFFAGMILFFIGLCIEVRAGMANPKVRMIVFENDDPSQCEFFCCPGIPLVPCIGVFVCLIVMSSIPLVSWGGLVGYNTPPVLIYFLYTVKRTDID